MPSASSSMGTSAAMKTSAAMNPPASVEASATAVEASSVDEIVEPASASRAGAETVGGAHASE
jgi:hypothetical protein